MILLKQVKQVVNTALTCHHLLDWEDEQLQSNLYIKQLQGNMICIFSWFYVHLANVSQRFILC